MRIQHNIMAMNAYRNYNTNTSALSKNLEKLSSGYKINRAGDDAAGLAISEKMRAQITGLNAAQKNVKDGISLVKTAEGAMQEIQDMLNRMDYLATQSANGTYDNEVDRLNLQKEVDALKSEINRIADSANFNGIKLLDGKAGVNTTAFTNFEFVDGVAAGDPKVDISAALAAESAGSPAFHAEGASATQQNPEAIIDLGDISITGADATGTVNLQFEVLGKTLTATMTGTTSYAKSDVASALLNAIKANTDLAVKTASGTAVPSHDSSSSGANNNAVKIGDNVYTIATDTAGLKLTLAGTVKAGKYTAATTGTPTSGTNDFDATQAAQMNADLGQSVKTGTITGGALNGSVVHMTTQVKQAIAHVDASKAGINLTLNENIVKQGNVLEIDGKKFKFELDDVTKTTEAGYTIINLAKEKAAGQDTVHAAADKLSQTTQFAGATDDTTRQWKIGTTSDGKTIHIEQSVSSASGKELDSYKKVTDKITVTNSNPSAAKGNGVAITVDTAKVAVGNKLQFGTGDDAVELEVVESGAVASKHQINKADIADATKLQAAIDPNKYTVEVADGTGDNVGKKIVTVRTKVATDANAAAVKASANPVISGTGLRLQIGDTSDSYNQLAVKIGDMHTAALGIDKLDISNPEGASAAIQTVRDAINQVSSVRGDLGAVQNRLEHTANNLSVMAENIQDAESTIRDTDVAEEMMAYTKNNILIQSAQAMLAQANAVPQGVLQLLG